MAKYLVGHYGEDSCSCLFTRRMQMPLSAAAIDVANKIYEFMSTSKFIVQLPIHHLLQYLLFLKILDLSLPA
jgi:hypothetical protein